MKIWTIALLMLMASLAGCTSNDADDDGTNPDESQGNDDAGLPGDDDQDDAPPEPLDPIEPTFYLGTTGLSQEVPADGKIEMQSWGLFAGTSSFSDAEFATEPFNRSMHIAPQTLEMTVWIQSDAAAVGNPAFDLAVWLGTSRGELAFAFTSVNVLTPNQPQEVTLNMGLEDNIDHVIPAGERLTIRVIGAYEPSSAGLHNILVGADTPTGFDLTMQPLHETLPLDGEEVETFTGTMEGGAFAECPADDEIHRFTVPDNAELVNLVLTGSNPASGERIDIDLDLYDGSTVLHHAGSPHATEEILLVGPALEPFLGQELGTSGSICLGPTADYEIELLIATAPAATETSVA